MDPVMLWLDARIKEADDKVAYLIMARLRGEPGVAPPLIFFQSLSSWLRDQRGIVT